MFWKSPLSFRRIGYSEKNNDEVSSFKTYNSNYFRGKTHLLYFSVRIRTALKAEFHKIYLPLDSRMSTSYSACFPIFW